MVVVTIDSKNEQMSDLDLFIDQFKFKFKT